MGNELALLHNSLIVGALMFAIGIVGFLSRRNMIVMFLSVELMLQGVSLSLVAWGRFYNDFGGQILVIFIIAVAAAEAAVALVLILALYQRSGSLDVAVWQALREANQPLFVEPELPEPEQTPPVVWPTLPPAGIRPEVPAADVDYRREV